MKREAGESPAQARCCESPRGRRGCQEPLREAKRKTLGRRQRQEASQKTCHGMKACCTLPADREEAREGGICAAHGRRSLFSGIHTIRGGRRGRRLTAPRGWCINFWSHEKSKLLADYASTAAGAGGWPRLGAGKSRGLLVFGGKLFKRSWAYVLCRCPGYAA